MYQITASRNPMLAQAILSALGESSTTAQGLGVRTNVDITEISKTLTELKSNGLIESKERFDPTAHADIVTYTLTDQGRRITLSNLIQPRKPIMETQIVTAPVRPVHTERKSKLVIIGLKGQQVTEIEREFGDRLRITFIGSDDNLQSVAPAVKGADAVIMTRFISHAHEEIVKSENVQFERCHGGMTEIAECINKLFPSSSDHLSPKAKAASIGLAGVKAELYAYADKLHKENPQQWFSAADFIRAKIVDCPDTTIHNALRELTDSLGILEMILKAGETTSGRLYSAMKHYRLKAGANVSVSVRPAPAPSKVVDLHKTTGKIEQDVAQLLGRYSYEEILLTLFDQMDKEIKALQDFKRGVFAQAQQYELMMNMAGKK